MDLLTTSGIENLISTYRYYEQNRRVYPLQQRKEKFTNLSNAWGELKTKLKTLESIVESFKSTDSDSVFNSKTAQVSSEEYLSATATSDAIRGTYSIQIDQLAKHDSVIADTKTADSASGVQAGTLTFRVTSGSFDEVISIETTGLETYQELMEMVSDAINEAANGSVTASVFAPVSGDITMTITAGDSGKDNEITLSDVSGNALDTIGLNLSSRVIASGGSAGYLYAEDELNAKLVFNGLNIERSSNTIDDLINGVTLELKKKMETGVPLVNITVDYDLEEIKNQVEDFISKFNEAYNYVKDNYNSTKEKRGIFTGNSNAFTLKQSMANSVYQQVTGLGDGELSFLSEIGIEFDPETGLSLASKSKLEDAVKSKPDEVVNLFASSDGVATRLYDLVDNYVKVDGVISHITDSYDDTISYLSDKITYQNEKIDSGAEILRLKYEQLQQQLADLLAGQNYFSQFGGSGLF